MTAPLSHLQEAQKLTADAVVDLYQINLKFKPVTYLFKDGHTVTWQGREYEGTAARMSGDQRSADGEESRPTLQVLNPLGVFNKFAMDGDLDLAVVTRKRLLLNHLEADMNVYEQRMWYVGRVRELVGGQTITLELRNMTEGPNFEIPVRMFIPPEFPLVTL